MIQFWRFFLLILNALKMIYVFIIENYFFSCFRDTMYGVWDKTLLLFILAFFFCCSCSSKRFMSLSPPREDFGVKKKSLHPKWFYQCYLCCKVPWDWKKDIASSDIGCFLIYCYLSMEWQYPKVEKGKKRKEKKTVPSVTNPAG